MSDFAKWFGLACALLVGCGAEAPEPGGDVGRIAQGLSDPGLAPVPCYLDSEGNSVIAWDGTSVELVVADALAECSWAEAQSDSETPTQGLDTLPSLDNYLDRVWVRATMSTYAVFQNTDDESLPCPIPPFCTVNFADTWASYRASSWNCDVSGDGSRVTYPLDLSHAVVEPPFADDSEAYSWNDRARGDLRLASVNLCMAQKLANTSARASAELLLSADEQLELANVVRERAQIAVHAYSVLAGVANDAGWDPNLYTAYDTERATNIRDYLLSLGVQGAQRWAGDYFAAIQLLISSTEDLAGLIVRSRSAGLGYEGISKAESDVERTWGKGSWQEQLAHLLYGGLMFGRDYEQSKDADYGSLAEYDQEGLLYYVDSEDLTPKQRELLRLAVRSDGVYHAFRATLGECMVPDPDRFDATYVKTQRALQRERCLARLGEFDDIDDVNVYNPDTGECYGENEEDVLGEFYGITAQDGLRVGEYLAAIFDRLEYQSPSCGLDKHARQLGVRGNVSFESYEGDFVMKLSGASAFEAPPIEDVSSVLRRGIPVRQAFDGRLSMAQHGFAATVPHSYDGMQFDGREAIEQVRRTGAVGVLEATARLVERLANPIESRSESSQAFVESVLDVLGPGECLNLIEAAIGKNYVEVVPRGAGAITSESLPYGQPNVSGDLMLVVPVVAGDPLLSLPTPGEPLRVCELQGDWVPDLASHPDLTSYSGETIGSLLLPEVLHGECAICDVSAPAEDPFPRFSCWFSPSQSTPGPQLVAYRQRGVELASDLLNGSGLVGRVKYLGRHFYGASVRWPFNWYRFSDGGKLGQIARTQLLPDPESPNRPAFDGFGIPSGWVPPFAGELTGGPDGASGVSYYLGAARASAQSAGEAVSSVLDNLVEEARQEASDRITDEQREAALQAASEEHALSLSEATQQLCGSGEGDCSSIEVNKMQLNREWYPSFATVAPGTHPCDEAGGMAADLIAKVLNNGGWGDLGDPDNGISAPGADALGWVEGDLTEWVDNFDYGMNYVFNPPGAPGPLDAVDTGLRLGLDVYNIVTGYDWVGEQLDTALEVSEEEAEYALKVMKCETFMAIETFLQTDTRIASPVEERLGESSVPLFDGFAGGALQQALITQWTAIKAPDEKIKYVTAALNASGARLSAANERLIAMGQEIRRNCSAAAMARAFAAGFSFGFPKGISWSAGPLLAQQDKCESLIIQLGPEMAELKAESAEAMASIAAAVQGFTEAGAAVQLASAEIDGLVLDANLAVARADGEKKIATALGEANYQSVNTTSFGLYRKYRDYRIWRARGLLETARRNALVARRAVEAHFVTDLAGIHSDEAFVVAPSAWANEVYEYDLSIPAALGLVAGGGADGSLAANKVEDYVSNLEMFVRGYSVTRPSAVARDEIEVLTLPGPVAHDVNEAEPTADDPSTESIYPTQGQWLASCDGISSLVPVPRGQADLQQLCVPEAGGAGYPPRSIQLAFSLDPWGRMSSGVANPAFERRYNGRWTRLAVNLVGTGVLDCSQAVDALECYGTGFVRYNLQHVGNPWVTDFIGQWRDMMLPTGWIEGGKAVALERWLEPMVDGWDTPFVSAAARTEFVGRPLGGEYVLELMLGAHVRPERIERVQILQGSEYWVAQGD